LALFWHRVGGPPVGGFAPYLVLKACIVRNVGRWVGRWTCTLFYTLWPPTTCASTVHPV